MYGVRGANGVIVINTKRGKVGAPSVKFACGTFYCRADKTSGFYWGRRRRAKRPADFSASIFGAGAGTRQTGAQIADSAVSDGRAA